MTASRSAKIPSSHIFYFRRLRRKFSRGELWNSLVNLSSLLIHFFNTFHPTCITIYFYFACWIFIPCRGLREKNRKQIVNEGNLLAKFFRARHNLEIILSHKKIPIFCSHFFFMKKGNFVLFLLWEKFFSFFVCLYFVWKKKWIKIEIYILYTYGIKV